MPAMPHAFDYDLDRCWPFAKQHLPGLARTEGMVCIGLRRDGELVAIMVYEGFNGVNMWGHLAGAPGARWMTRAFLKACFAYPFVVCGLSRLSGYVNASNHAAVRLDKHLGFREEARLKGAAADGGDVIIFMMRKEDCRYVDSQ